MPSSGARIESFDALRGLAACSVVIGHFLLVLRGAENPPYAGWHDAVLAYFGHTPLSILWSGHAAVVLFFVLSGFVLQLMLEGGRLTYGAYAAKRILRLYLPYIVAVGLGIAGQQWLYGGDLAGLGDWINKFWTDDPGPRAMLGHLTVIGAFDSSTYDFTIWTLVHEMRISLLFPLVFLMTRRLRWWTVLGGFGLASVVMAGLRIAVFSGHDELAGFARDGGYTAYVFTVHYLLAFAIGGVLADRRERLAAIQAGLPARTRALLLALGLTLDIYGARR